jgi:phosphoribosylaminoimidazolecarboxamide formyltransferase/IMP cyclohydrolase
VNAILSVHDKRDLVDFARVLAERGIILYSTGGTEAILREHAVPVKSVSELTGFPEILGGRVKTLHPRVHGGILALDQPAQLAEAAAQGIELIDFVVVNLHPFAQAVAAGAGLQEALEQIDIGGVTLLRAGAKNFGRVTVIALPEDYERVALALRTEGTPSLELRRRLAVAAFALTANYDAQIAAYLADPVGTLPDVWAWAGQKVGELRYGENPHQRAAAYRAGPPGVLGARQLQGSELSYNNVVDLDAGWRLVSDFEEPAAAIIKHTNPCGASVAATLAGAYEAAHGADPRSAFGGIVALNRELDLATAELLTQTFLEGVVAPAVSPTALPVLARKAKLRVLELAGSGAAPAVEVRTVSGGFLAQTPDQLPVERRAMRVVTKRSPSAREWEDLLFAWRVVKHVRSNAIVLAHSGCAVGVGAGQMSRVESVELAIQRAGARAQGSVAASDGFFPQPDGVLAVARGGATAIIQPGGSVKDADAIKAADGAGLAMVFTGSRHFRH